MRSSVNNLREELASRGHKLPKNHLLGATNGELIVDGLTQLNVLDHATPGNAFGCFCEDRGTERHLSDDMPVSHVPNEHLSVEGVSSRHKKAVVVREG